MTLPLEAAGKNWRNGCIRELTRRETAQDLAGYEDLRRFCGIWGKRMNDFFGEVTAPGFAEALAKIVAIQNEEDPLYTELEPLEPRRDHLRRILILRAEIAAAVALEAMGDVKARQETLGRLDCETSPF